MTSPYIRYDEEDDDHDHHPERFDESNEKFLNAATIVATDDSYRTPEITHADPKDALERIKNLPTAKEDPSYE